MACKCKDFKCAKGCKCPVNKESVIVLEDMLNEMLNISGMSNVQSTKKSTLPADDCQEYKDDRFVFERAEDIHRPDERFNAYCQAPNETIIDEICPPNNLYDTFYELENEIYDPKPQVKRKKPAEAVKKFMMQQGIERRAPNETIIDEICPPYNLYDTFYELEDERCEPPPQVQDPPQMDRKQQAEVVKKLMMQNGMKRRSKEEVITNYEEYKAATKDYNPEIVSKMIDTNLQKMTEFQKNYKKSPPKKRELYDICWSNYLKEVDYGSRTVEQAMNKIVDDWAAYTESKKRRKKKLPPHCDPMLGESYYAQKVYPPERYLA